MSEYSAYSTTVKLLALSRYGEVGPRLMEALLREFYDLDAILSADQKALTHISGLTPAMAARIVASRTRLNDAGAYADELRGRDIGVTSRFDDQYPHRLFELNDPPLMLYFRGRLLSPDQKAVAIVGSDEATADGIEMASRLSRLFSEAGVLVLASLEGGIAAAAHLAAKSVGRPSFALIDSGFDALNGTEKLALAIDIAMTGGVLSEYPPETAASDETMAQSNRLLVGLANAVVFTELYTNSRRALDLLEFCNQIGKLTFFFTDPKAGVLADPHSLRIALANGAIPMSGFQSTQDIIRSLV